MKLNLVFSLLILFMLSSCNVQNLPRDPITNKRVKTFINKDFEFKYPKKWKLFRTKGFEKDIIVRIAHKNEISERYMAVESRSDNGATNIAYFISVNTDKEDIKKKHKKFIYDKYLTGFAKNQFNISVEKIDFDKLADFIEKRKKRIAEVEHVEGTFKKIDENHYSNDLMIFKDTKDKDMADQLTQFHLLHYYYKNGLLYTLVFTTTPEKNHKYKDEKELIFRTFKFKK